MDWVVKGRVYNGWYTPHPSPIDKEFAAAAHRVSTPYMLNEGHSATDKYWEQQGLHEQVNSKIAIRQTNMVAQERKKK